MSRNLFSGNPAADRWIASTASGSSLNEGVTSEMAEGEIYPENEKPGSIRPEPRLNVPRGAIFGYHWVPFEETSGKYRLKRQDQPGVFEKGFQIQIAAHHIIHQERHHLLAAFLESLRRFDLGAHLL